MTPVPGAAIVFWFCCSLLVYAYVGYPLLLMLLVCLRPAARRRLEAPREGELPTVALVIAAHNEEAEIRQRIDNALAVQYPRRKFEVVVASDG